MNKDIYIYIYIYEKRYLFEIKVQRDLHALYHSLLIYGWPLKFVKLQRDLHALYHSLLELGGGCHEPSETIYGRVG